jgi:poly(hydroxyalkanoate) depolymerase family esterase
MAVKANAMPKRIRNPLWSRSFQRTLTAMIHTAMRADSKAMTQALRSRTPASAKKTAVKSAPPFSAQWSTGFAAGTAGALRYRLFKPPGVRRSERLPLLVMLHGCGQDAQAVAASTRMNQIAARERFLVLYPEQDRLSNLQGCWNWHQTRSGRAQGEAGAIAAAIDQICLTQPVDPARIALAGLSAGAGMAALLATRYPERFRAIAMHSGIAPGVAHSSATALTAMRGRRVGVPLAPLVGGVHLPALLVIQGSADPLIAPSNGVEAARLWAAREGAKAGLPRTVQRGARYPANITDYRSPGRLVATLCEIVGLGHAWSGGAASQNYSDPKGPDASRMIWAFAVRQFANAESRLASKEPDVQT